MTYAAVSTHGALVCLKNKAADLVSKIARALFYLLGKIYEKWKGPNHHHVIPVEVAPLPREEAPRVHEVVGAILQPIPHLPQQPIAPEVEPQLPIPAEANPAGVAENAVEGVVVPLRPLEEREIAPPQIIIQIQPPDQGPESRVEELDAIPQPDLLSPLFKQFVSMAEKAFCLLDRGTRELEALKQRFEEGGIQFVPNSEQKEFPIRSSRIKTDKGSYNEDWFYFNLTTEDPSAELSISFTNEEGMRSFDLRITEQGRVLNIGCSSSSTINWILIGSIGFYADLENSLLRLLYSREDDGHIVVNIQGPFSDKLQGREVSLREFILKNLCFDEAYRRFAVSIK